MIIHAPADYDCPFCRISKSIARDGDLIAEQFIYSDADVFAIVARHNWERVPLNVLVIPHRHVENLYALPTDLAIPIHRVTRAMARTIRLVTSCDGISTRQHNEPCGDQDVWHYHLHVTPRVKNDQFYERRLNRLDNKDMASQTSQLRKFVQANPTVFDDT